MKLLSTNKVKEIFGVHRNTLYNWRQKGLIKNYPTPTGKVRYEESEILKLVRDKEDKTAILYSRVSSSKQKDDLIRQADRIRNWAVENGFSIVSEYSEVGSGLNSKRKKINCALDDIRNGKASNLIVEHNDRLTRFGFEFIEKFCNEFGCKIVIIEDSGVKEDIVKDLIDIIVCFSSKLYGKRSSVNKVKNIVESLGE